MFRFVFAHSHLYIFQSSIPQSVDKRECEVILFRRKRQKSQSCKNYLKETCIHTKILHNITLFFLAFTLLLSPIFPFSLLVTLASFTSQVIINDKFTRKVGII